MWACTSISSTVSPAEGLPVVLLLTVPVVVAACASEAKEAREKTASAKREDIIGSRSVLHPDSSKSFWRLCLLQPLNLGEQLCGLGFKRRALRFKVFFGILSGAIFKVQIAQVFVKLFFALQQIIELRLLPLRGEGVFRPEGVNKGANQQQQSGNQSGIRAN